MPCWLAELAWLCLLVVLTDWEAGLALRAVLAGCAGYYYNYLPQDSLWPGVLVAESVSH